MPQLYNFGGYIIYFWSNENKPLEPVHVHIAIGKPSPNGTKIWITNEGKALLANNDFKIPSGRLKLIIRFIEANSKEITDRWLEHFGEIRYFC